MDSWYNLISGHQDLPVFIVGNKADLNEKRKVSTEEGQNYAEQHNFHFIEVSSLTGENIESLFSEIANI